jgi:hypothetical protein
MEDITLISFIGGESVRDAEREVQRKESSFYCYCCLPLQLGSKKSLLFGEPPFVHLRLHSPMTRTLYLLIDSSTAAHNIFDLSFYRLRASQSLSYFKAHGLETHPNF